jgi:hypothetical protein
LNGLADLRVKDRNERQILTVDILRRYDNLKRILAVNCSARRVASGAHHH